MKILVTGGAGFVGSNLSNALSEMGHEVLVIDNLKNGKIENLDEKISLLVEDLTMYDLKENLDYKPDIIFHLICTGLIESIMYPKVDLTVNGYTILNVLEYAEKVGAAVIYTSSGAVHGKVERSDLPLHELSKKEPNNFYGSTKLLAEYYCKIFTTEKKVPTMIVRLWNVFGYPQRINYDIGWVPVVTAFMTLDKPEVWGDGKQTRDFTYVKDIVNGLIKGMEYLLKNLETSEIINLNGGRETSILELYEKCSKLVGRQYTPEHKPPSPGDVPFFLASNNKAKELLDWEPRSIDDALLDYYTILKEKKLIK
jgi:UDP-glucose 4-epimerase